LVDELVVIIGPKIIGQGVEVLGDLGISEIDQAIGLSIERIRRVGDDLVIVAKMK
jgi:riboflavin biosynthesis pyrimidine reductase